MEETPSKEERKILKLGNSSYVVSLPLKWLEKNNLNKGDSLQFYKEGENYLISPGTETTNNSEIEIEFQKPRKVFMKRLVSAYFKNYKTISIKGENLKQELEYFKQSVNNLNNLQIYEIGDENIVLKDLSDVAQLDLNELITKIIKYIKSIFEELESNELNFTLIKEIDSNINNLTYLAFKCLNYKLQNTFNRNLIINSIHYWRTIFALEDIGDILKRIGRYLKEENNQVAELKILFQSTKNYFEEITSFVFTNNNKNHLYNYIDQKQSLLKEIENSREKFKDSISLFLVITQLLKDVIGKMELIIVSVIDME